MIAQTAAEALAKYQQAFEADALTQNAWHLESDGRHLACALGVLGDEVDSARKCPAQIMPRWLAQMVPWFFDGMEFDDAKAWGLKFYEQIARLNGAVPFTAIHDWQATAVGPLAIEVAERSKRKVEAHKAMLEMQAAAAAGTKFTADEWRPVLKAAFYDAYANADADADANVFADADAYAVADAFAYADANANAKAYAYANVYAYANAYANAKKAAIKRLACGMVEALSRAALGE